MRRCVAGVALAFVCLGAHTGRADVAYPAIPENVNPSTVTWFYGCTDALPGACLTMGIGRTTSGADNFVGFYGSGTGLVTPFGVTYSVNDAWSWQLPDGSCSGGGTNLFWAPNSCFVQNIASEVFKGRVDWPDAIVGLKSAAISLTATPEPASIVLVATAFLTLVGVARPRRRVASRERST